MRRRFSIFLVALAATLALAGVAAAITVHVRVEGLTTTIYGAQEPLLTPFSGALVAEDGSAHTLAEPTALGALEAASRKGEFYYRLRALSFGLFVDRVGRYPSGGSSGWVYKVNGVSPSVGAADYVLTEGDRVVWYFAKFGPGGGPETLELERAGGGCYRAVSRDDKGRSKPARDVVFLADGKRARSPSGRFCPAGSWSTLRVSKAGAIRSEVVVLD